MEQQHTTPQPIFVREPLRRKASRAPLDRETLSELDLVVLAQAGDAEAFALLVQRHEPRLATFAQRYFADPLDIADAVQETFARAYARLHTFTPSGRFGSWLLTICAHWSIDTLRHRQRRVQIVALDTAVEADSFISALPGPEEIAIIRCGNDEAARLLDTLPPHYCAVLVLHYAQGYSYNEIARTLELPLSTVRMRLFHARAALRTIATT
jgi:RNA polymerase sigma-70 factor (ECF subfamily)